MSEADLRNTGPTLPKDPAASPGRPLSWSFLAACAASALLHVAALLVVSIDRKRPEEPAAIVVHLVALGDVEGVLAGGSVPEQAPPAPPEILETAAPEAPVETLTGLPADEAPPVELSPTVEDVPPASAAEPPEPARDVPPPVEALPGLPPVAAPEIPREVAAPSPTETAPDVEPEVVAARDVPAAAAPEPRPPPPAARPPLPRTKPSPEAAAAAPKPPSMHGTRQAAGPALPDLVPPTPGPPKSAPGQGLPEGAPGGIGDAAMDRYVTQLYRMIDERKVYPRQSARRREEGTIMLRLVIAADGSLLDVSIVDQGPRNLVNAALDAVKRAAPFLPLPTAAGVRQAVFEIPVNYRLK